MIDELDRLRVPLAVRMDEVACDQPDAVTIGGVADTVSYSGAAPSLIAGLTQINAQVPAGVTPGTKVPVVVTIGTWQSQSGVTMAVQ